VGRAGWAVRSPCLLRGPVGGKWCCCTAATPASRHPSCHSYPLPGRSKLPATNLPEREPLLPRPGRGGRVAVPSWQEQVRAAAELLLMQPTLARARITIPAPAAGAARGRDRGRDGTSGGGRGAGAGGGRGGAAARSRGASWRGRGVGRRLGGGRWDSDASVEEGDESLDDTTDSGTDSEDSEEEAWDSAVAKRRRTPAAAAAAAAALKRQRKEAATAGAGSSGVGGGGGGGAGGALGAAGGAPGAFGAPLDAAAAAAARLPGAIDALLNRQVAALGQVIAEATAAGVMAPGLQAGATGEYLAVFPPAPLGAVQMAAWESLWEPPARASGAIVALDHGAGLRPVMMDLAADGAAAAAQLAVGGEQQAVKAERGE
jgi:hypothetical protein